VAQLPTYNLFSMSLKGLRSAVAFGVALTMSSGL